MVLLSLFSLLVDVLCVGRVAVLVKQIVLEQNPPFPINYDVIMCTASTVDGYCFSLNFELNI